MTLKLSINKKAFDVMVSGEKTEEFREESKWIMSRLLNKKYNFVQFTNGYGKERPVFLAKYLGYSMGNVDKVYSNGLSVSGDKVIIQLGEITEKHNTLFENQSKLIYSKFIDYSHENDICEDNFPERDHLIKTSIWDYILEVKTLTILDNCIQELGGYLKLKNEYILEFGEIDFEDEMRVIKGMLLEKHFHSKVIEQIRKADY